MFSVTIQLVAFDFETTGLSPRTDEIVEIGAVKFGFAIRGGQMDLIEKGTFESLVRPHRMIPQKATDVHGITDEMVAKAPPTTEVLGRFMRFCGQSSVLVAHNGHGFDAPFLAETLRRHHMPVPALPVLDSLKLARNLLREQTHFRLQDLALRLREGGDLPFNLERGELHRALYDCRVLMHVAGRLLLRNLPEKDLALDRFGKAVERISPILHLDQFGR